MGKNGKSLYVFGALYPLVTGGMEIFNYYFLKAQLEAQPDQILYVSKNPVAGFEGQQIRLRNWKPQRLFQPVQLFFILLWYRRRIKLVYTGYARDGWMIPFLNGLIYRFFRIPYLVTVHSGGDPDWKRPFAYRFYLNHARELIGVSVQICRDYAAALHRPLLRYIPPLVPFVKPDANKLDIKKKHGFQPDDTLMLFAGSLKPLKNPDILLEAFFALGNEFLQQHRLKLVIAGAGPLLSELKHRCSKAGFDPHVRFAGLVPKEELPEYFCMADYYAICSDYEGTSVSLLEAMFNKLPVVAAASPGLQDMLKHMESAVLYPAKDPEALAAAIRKVVSDPVLSANLGEKGFEDYSKYYSYENMMAQYRRLFNRVN